jgi:hypothetical protein
VHRKISAHCYGDDGSQTEPERVAPDGEVRDNVAVDGRGERVWLLSGKCGVVRVGEAGERGVHGLDTRDTGAVGRGVLLVGVAHGDGEAGVIDTAHGLWVVEVSRAETVEGRGALARDEVDSPRGGQRDDGGTLKWRRRRGRRTTGIRRGRGFVADRRRAG